MKKIANVNEELLALYFRKMSTLNCHFLYLLNISPDHVAKVLSNLQKKVLKRDGAYFVYIIYY